MNEKEYFEKYDKIQEEYKKEQKELEEEYFKKQKILYINYMGYNKLYTEGDILKRDDGIIILVENIFIVYPWGRELPSVTYEGVILNKSNLMPNKRGKRESILEKRVKEKLN